MTEYPESSTVQAFKSIIARTWQRGPDHWRELAVLTSVVCPCGGSLPPHSEIQAGLDA